MQGTLVRFKKHYEILQRKIICLFKFEKKEENYWEIFADIL